jgi:hypothetical protein
LRTEDEQIRNHGIALFTHINSGCGVKVNEKNGVDVGE